MWSVSTILTGLQSFMLDDAPTLGSIEATPAQRRKFAATSLEANCGDSTFCKLFPELVEKHEERQRELAEQRADGGCSSEASDESRRAAEERTGDGAQGAARAEQRLADGDEKQPPSAMAFVICVVFTIGILVLILNNL
jgi:hypothetical protein